MSRSRQQTMSSESPKNIRQVQLPSGKIIEVLYFAGQQDPALEGDIDAQRPARAPQAADGARPPRRGPPHLPALHRRARLPRRLGRGRSQALGGGPALPRLRVDDVGIFTQDAVERFDLELDRGAEVLLRDLQQLARANMADDVERFIVALRDDHIEPSDF